MPTHTSLAALTLLTALAALATSACQSNSCQVLVHRDGTLAAIRHYADDGHLRQVDALDNNALRVWTYTPRGELASIRFSSEVQSFVPPPLGFDAFADPFERSDIRYDYDDNGRLLSAARTDIFLSDNTALGSIPEADATHTLTELYTYDDAGRLLQVRVVTDPTRQLEPRLALEIDRSVPNRLTLTRLGPDGLPTEKVNLLYQGDVLTQRQVTPCTRQGTEAVCTETVTTDYTYGEAGHLTRLQRGPTDTLTLIWEGDLLQQVRQGAEDKPDRLDTYTWSTTGRLTSRSTVDHAAEAWNQRRPVTGNGALGTLVREAARETRAEEGYVYTPACAAVPITDLAPNPTRRFIDPDYQLIGEELDLGRAW